MGLGLYATASTVKSSEYPHNIKIRIYIIYINNDILYINCNSFFTEIIIFF